LLAAAPLRRGRGSPLGCRLLLAALGARRRRHPGCAGSRAFSLPGAGV